MTGASKILTVSYGTFSCTLEGFDDPFNTMKAIAEYFRDLAAEDRYFGAEPPTPDAAMLHRIAEREIQRRVEAKVQENGIVLRASDGNAPVVSAEPLAAAPADPAPQAPRLMEAAPQATETVAEKLSRLRAEAAGQSVAPATNVLSLAVPSAAAYSVPEFESPDFGEEEGYDLPATVTTGFDAVDTPVTGLDAVADSLPEAQPDPLSDLPEDAEQATDTPDEDAVTAADAATDVRSEDPEVAAQAEAQLPPDTDVIAETAAAIDAVAEDAAAATAAQADRTDALLSSLIAGLSTTAAPATEDDVPAASTPDAWAFDEDEDEDEQDDLRALDPEMPDAPETDAAAAVSDLAHITAVEGFDSAEPFAETAQDDIAFADADLDATDTLPSDEAEPMSNGTAGEESIFAADEADGEIAPLQEDVGADVQEISLFAADETDDLPAPTDTGLASADDVPAEDAVAEEPVAAAAPAELRPDASEKLMRARARVIRIRRTEAGEPVTDVQLAPVQPVETAAPPAVGTPAPAAILSPEAEADLAAELAALRAANEALDRDDTAPAAPRVQADETTVSPGDAARRAFEDAGADATISRLLAQADEHLEGPESKRRLSAIAHLKAAVAATVAERRATGDKPKDGEPSQLSRYRDDLAKVVRNKLGGGGGSAQTERLAPLVLVSEQRIDRPRPVAVPTPGPAASVVPPAPQPVPQAGASVVPRRIASSASLAFAQDDEEDETEDFAAAVADSRGFMDFADRLGAKSLGELIEASAAYLACVEGREHFTRPQLMGLVQAALPEGDIPREDGLRSFGTLLRSGRIEKIRRGQFAISDRSSYLAEGRRIAG